MYIYRFIYILSVHLIYPFQVNLSFVWVLTSCRPELTKRITNQQLMWLLTCKPESRNLAIGCLTGKEFLLGHCYWRFSYPWRYFEQTKLRSLLCSKLRTRNNWRVRRSLCTNIGYCHCIGLMKEERRTRRLKSLDSSIRPDNWHLSQMKLQCWLVRSKRISLKPNIANRSYNLDYKWQRKMSFDLQTKKECFDHTFV